MLVLAVAGILLALAVPPLSRALDQVEVVAATSHVVAAHQRARMMALARGEVLILSIDSASVTIASRGDSTPLWSEAGPARSGVDLSGPTRHFTFSPEGFTLGLSNASLRLSRGSSVRTIVVSRLGRVRVLK